MNFFLTLLLSFLTIGCPGQLELETRKTKANRDVQSPSNLADKDQRFIDLSNKAMDLINKLQASDEEKIIEVNLLKEIIESQDYEKLKIFYDGLVSKTEENNFTSPSSAVSNHLEQQISAKENQQITLISELLPSTYENNHYQWELMSGSLGIDLETETQSEVTFILPNYQENGELIIKVTHPVSDNEEFFIVSVLAENDKPMANAGQDQVINSQEQVILDASQSSDSDSQELTFAWAQISGPSVEIISAHNAQAIFFAKNLAPNSVLEFEVSVNDGHNPSVKDATKITIQNLPPIASAGTDQSISEGSIVTLDASGSVDPEGQAVTFNWNQIGGNPTVSLSSSTIAQPAFMAPELLTGTSLSFEVSVSDGINPAVTDTVVITVNADNDAPSASAGADQSIPEGSMVTLDASGSVDPEGQAMTYSWNQINGSPTVSLSSSTIAQPAFTAPELLTGASLSFEVSVSDGINPAVTDTVVINVNADNDAPTASAGADQSILEGVVVTLDATGSTDPESQPLSYSWSQTGGTIATLSSTSIAQPTFTAPNVSGSETLTFQISISDGVNIGITNTVDITVNEPDISLSASGHPSFDENCRINQSGTSSYGSGQSYLSSSIDIVGFTEDSQIVSDSSWQVVAPILAIESVSSFSFTWTVYATPSGSWDQVNGTYDLTVGNPTLPSTFNESGTVDLHTIALENTQPTKVGTCQSGIRAGVAAAEDGTCILQNSGAIYCFGRNDQGQLGDGAIADTGTPNLVDNTAIDGLTPGTTAVQISGKNDSYCALMQNGTIKCWGQGGQMRLGEGNGTSNDEFIPVDVDQSVVDGLTPASTAIGIHHNNANGCAIMANLSLYCWGVDWDGRLGNGGSNVDTDTPTQVSGFDGLSDAGRAVSVAIGLAHACAITKAGRVACWGNGASGRLGNNSSSSHDNPNFIAASFFDSSTSDPDKTPVMLSLGDTHSCALVASGKVFCWGNGNDGRLGDGNTGNHNEDEPVQVLGFDGLTAATTAVSITAGWFHNCALMANGTVKCWGRGGDYRLGNASTSDYGIPQSVTGAVITGASNATTAIALAAGFRHVCAVMGDGKVACWGQGGNGALGDNDTSWHTEIEPHLVTGTTDFATAKELTLTPQ